MGLIQEKEIIPEGTGQVKDIREAGQEIGGELRETEEILKETVEEDSRSQEKVEANIPPSETPEPKESAEKKEVFKGSELEGKSLEELEPILADRIDKTDIGDIEGDPVINGIIEKIVGDLSDPDIKDETVAAAILNIASNSSKGDEGTRSWLQQTLLNRVIKARASRPKM